MKQESTPATFTLRIPRDLKEKAEEIAAAERMSMNTWLLRLMERAVRAQKVKPQ
jgi:predicted HicB family RNase H-like nuclease